MVNAARDSRNSPLLTVLIPTYNRFNNVIELLDSFCKYLTREEKSLIEIVISENVTKVHSEIVDIIDNYSSLIDIKLVNPPVHLISAEENLFFGWQYVTGKYVWTLGDDDPVNFEVLTLLLNECKSQQHAIFKFNADLLNHKNVIAGEVTKSSVDEALFPLKDFLQVVGFWHTGAGFSTWIFKKSLIEPSLGLEWVQSFRSPVYSHVTFFLYSCADVTVTFINKPLVHYRINSYVDHKTGQNHWDIYTSKVKMPRYYPWTLGFVKQLLRLESNGIISDNYWGTVLGDHVGSKRFLEINSMISLTIKQLSLQRVTNVHGYDKGEIYELSQFFRKNRPDLHYLWDMFEDYGNSFLLKSRASELLLRRIQLSWYSNLILDPYKFHRKSNFKYHYRIGVLEFTVNRRKKIERHLSLNDDTIKDEFQIGQFLWWTGPFSRILLHNFSQIFVNFAPNFVIAAISELARLLHRLWRF